MTKRVAKLPTPTWLFICRDGPDTLPLREKHLFGHLDQIEAHNPRYRVAGPVRDEPDGPIVGSVFLVEAPTRAEAEAFMAGDPYISSRMYESVEVLHFVPACGEWLGGVIWDQDEIRANLERYVGRG